MGMEEDDVLAQVDSELKKASDSNRLELKDQVPIHMVICPGKLLTKTPKLKRAKMLVCVTHWKIPTDTGEDRTDTRICMKSFGAQLPCPKHCDHLARAEASPTRIIQKQAARLRDKGMWPAFHLQAVQVNDPNIRVLEGRVGASVVRRFRDCYTRWQEKTGGNLFSWETCTPIGLIRIGKEMMSTRYYGLHEKSDEDEGERPKKLTLMDEPYKGPKSKIRLPGYGQGMNAILKKIGSPVTVADLSKQLKNLEQELLDQATTDQDDGEDELLEFLGLGENNVTVTKKIGGKTPTRRLAAVPDPEPGEGEEAAEDEAAAEGGDEVPDEEGGAMDENGEPAGEAAGEPTDEAPEEPTDEVAEEPDAEVPEEAAEGGEEPEAPEDTGEGEEPQDDSGEAPAEGEPEDAGETPTDDGEGLLGGDDDVPTDDAPPEADEDALTARVNKMVAQTSQTAKAQPPPAKPVAKPAPPKPAPPAPKPAVKAPTPVVAKPAPKPPVAPAKPVPAAAKPAPPKPAPAKPAAKK